jgi:hypothetical protein
MKTLIDAVVELPHLYAELVAAGGGVISIEAMGSVWSYKRDAAHPALKVHASTELLEVAVERGIVEIVSIEDGIVYAEKLRDGINIKMFARAPDTDRRAA